ncbi:lipoate protein ligase C-terminal domain-containing protein [Thermococcus waiotapuensis]|uniref:lipoate--protein ligase n=1 Tax=Thermococcus waiotapuensis TaxID=90909 RepID=A0AAE4T376_9EURY|nr:lipoate protein ligase C-terminal domain-containing protein [Thermococcus waiotapuensis]MDV3104782.1 lipoate protein ligase C-terminal domain-containing protein [Thermococcus waiotapuensis]
MKHRMGEHKARKGLIRIEFDEENGVAKHVRITGDFFVHPEEAVHELEEKLEGHRLDELERLIEEFFAVRMDIEMPYVNVEDFKIALKKALEG